MLRSAGLAGVLDMGGEKTSGVEMVVLSIEIEIWRLEKNYKSSLASAQGASILTSAYSFQCIGNTSRTGIDVNTVGMACLENLLQFICSGDQICGTIVTKLLTVV